jgi:NADPH:quinone reductase
MECVFIEKQTEEENNLIIGTKEIPKLSKDSVLIKNHYGGLNYIDTYHQSGLYKVPLPFILGVDGSGVIEEVGQEVKNFKKGDRVSYYTMKGGSLAEYIVLNENDNIVKVPDEIPLNLSCACMVQGLTGHYLTHDTYPIQQGDNVLIQACTGGTGSVILQLAKIKGARTIGTVGSQEKVEIAKALGCDDVILYKEKDFEVELKKFLPKGVNVVYDGVGKSTYEKSMKCLDKRGFMVFFGNASGSVPPIDPLSLTALGSIYMARPSLKDYCLSRSEFEKRSNDLFDYVSSGKLKLKIHKEFDYKDASLAYKELTGRNSTGKILLKFIKK